jgi:hypothetical protein
MNRRDALKDSLAVAEDAEGLGTHSGPDDTTHLQLVSASRHDRVMTGGLSALTASLRFILSVIAG